MIELELRQIKYFIEVAKREHVTDAANALHVAQSAVSRQIFNLEAELGVDLFIREGRSIRLTTVGRAFLERMEQAMNVIDDARQIVQEYTDPERGTIHIGFPSSLATYMLPTAISAFRNEYPHVKFSLNQGSYHYLKEAVVRGDVNIALMGPVPTNVEKTKGTILFTEDLVALLPKKHPLAKEQSITLNDLRNDSFILFPEGYILREIVDKACSQFGFIPRMAFEGEDIDGLKGLASAGLGVTIVPEITIVENIPRSTVAIPIVEPSVTRTVGMLIPTERALLPTEELFLQFLKNFFKRLEKFQQ